MKIKNYKKFLEEISIKDHPSMDDDYLRDVESKSKEKLEITGREHPHQFGGRLMQLLQRSKSLTQGKERELEDLAKRVMLENFGDILKRYEISLRINMVDSGSDVSDFMNEIDDQMDKEVEFSQWVEVTDQDVKNEVYKRKIANLIIQGESKNTKHILHSDICKNGIKEIYGEEKGEEIFNMWDEMTKLADKLDWLIPTEIRSQMMQMNPEGMSGASGVSWDMKLDDDDEDEYEEWSGEEDEEDMYDMEYEEEELSYTPVLNAVGIDFPMLLHESVKGLFEILSLGGVPDDPEVARTTFVNTGLEDEPEDWKYGPQIAKDFRKFLNKNPNIDKYPNVREEVYKMLIDKQTMSTEDFLDLFKQILKGTAYARKKVDEIIDKAIQLIEDYNQWLIDMEQYEKDLAAWEMSQKGEQPIDVEKEVEDVKDYSDMSKSEIQSLIDDALTKRDFELVDKLSKYLK